MADLTDTEIVAACARASQIEYRRCCGSPECNDKNLYIDHGVYNPLTDRAQAMELVEKLRLAITPLTGGWLVVGKISGGAVDADEHELLRAICLCAARVQIEKEKNANG